MRAALAAQVAQQRDHTDWKALADEIARREEAQAAQMRALQEQLDAAYKEHDRLYTEVNLTAVRVAAENRALREALEERINYHETSEVEAGAIGEPSTDAAARFHAAVAKELRAALTGAPREPQGGDQ